MVAFSWAGPLVRFTDAPALGVALWRLLFSVVFLAAIVSLRREGWRPLLQLGRRDRAIAAGAGVLLAFHFWGWIASLQYTTVASSVILVSTQPLFVALLSGVLLGEHPRRGEWLGIGVAVVGAGWIGWGDLALGPRALLGDAMALGAALLAAAYYIAGRSLRRSMDLWSYVTVVYGAAAVVLLGLAVVHPHVAVVRGYEANDWLVFLGLAAGPMLLGHTGVNYALRYVRAYLANLATLGEPIGATLIAWLLPAIAETPDTGVLIGGALIVAGVGLTLRAR